MFCHKVAPKFVDKYKKHIKYLTTVCIYRYTVLENAEDIDVATMDKGIIL